MCRPGRLNQLAVRAFHRDSSRVHDAVSDVPDSSSATDIQDSDGPDRRTRSGPCETETIVRRRPDGSSNVQPMAAGLIHA